MYRGDDDIGLPKLILLALGLSEMYDEKRAQNSEEEKD